MDMTTSACTTCDGCGRVANDEDMTPWSLWEAMPAASKLAINMGLVRPVTCPDCAGSGRGTANESAAASV